jgi:hypothetical protein
MIAYGALVETVHTHGYVSLGHTDAAAIRDIDGSSADNYSHQSDCSICQFQRQLFDAFVPATLFARMTVSEVAFTSARTISYRPTSIKPRSGRAPPPA